MTEVEELDYLKHIFYLSDCNQKLTEQLNITSDTMHDLASELQTYKINEPRLKACIKEYEALIESQEVKLKFYADVVSRNNMDKPLFETREKELDLENEEAGKR